MKILFANPPWFEFDVRGNAVRSGVRAGSRWPFTRPTPYAPDNFRFGAYLPFPFFLASAAAWAKTFIPDAQVEVRDSIARGESYDRFFRDVFAMAPDFIIIETGAASWPHDLQLVKVLKNRIPGLQVAIAGPTAAEASKNTMPGIVDAFLVGEYEKNVVKFVNSARGKLDFDLLSRDEMKAPPFPMFDEKCALNYWDACPKGQTAPHLQLFTSRGCYHKCCFCAWPGTMTGDDPDGTKRRDVRFHSAEWVESFVLHRMAISSAAGTPLQAVMLDDDTVNLVDRHTLEICAAMKRVGLPWSAMCRADTSTPEVWRAMKDAGCFGVKLGFESGSQRVIDQIINKKLDLVKAAKTAIWLRKEVGMTVHGTFTVGLPGETTEEQQMTRDFIAELYVRGALDTHQLSGTALIEGTPLEKIAQGEHLKAYPGAVSEGFVVNSDGNKKLDGLENKS